MRESPRVAGLRRRRRRKINYFGLCPPQRLLFQKNAEGLLEPLSFLTEEQNLGTEVRDLVFRMNDRVCSAIGLERW